MGRTCPRGARLRHDRRRVAGRRPLRRAAALILYAAFGSSRHLVVGPRRRPPRSRPRPSATSPQVARTTFVQLTDHAGARCRDPRARRRRAAAWVSSRASSPSRSSRGSSSASRSRSRRPAPEALRRREERGRTSSRSSGVSSTISVSTSGLTLLVGLASLASCSGSRSRTARARLPRRRARSASSPSSSSTSTSTAWRSSARSRAVCPPRAAGRRPHRLPRPRAGGFRRDALSPSPRASPPPRHTPLTNHYEIDANRELLGLGAATLGAGLSSGIAVVRQPLQDSRQWRRRALIPSSPGFVDAVRDHPHAALPHVPLRRLFPRPRSAPLSSPLVIDLVDISPAWCASTGFRHPRRRPRLRASPRGPTSSAVLAALKGVLIFDILPGLFVGSSFRSPLLVYRTSRPHIRPRQGPRQRQSMGRRRATS